uniref:Fatty acid-binding protein n=1 Tax=Abscondita cerata TaxID=2740424 RepID=G1FKW0_9COLE|nr:fatty acid-binding protein [Abscondita cerata]2N93_A Chain A, Fatty acid-binding protein [Abscondita cerata]
MVQLAGTYKLEKNENFEEYLAALGVPQDSIKKANSPGVVYEIIVNGNKFTFKSSSGMNSTLIVNEEVEEVLGTVNMNIKSFTKLEGSKLVVNSELPDGRKGTRTYEFCDKGFVLTMCAGDMVAKRYFIRT